MPALAKGVLISPDGTRQDLVVNGLKDMQSAVGGWIELIGLPDYDVYINKDGIAMDLPANPVATRHVKEQLRRDGRVVLTADGWILGPALFIGRDGEGDLADCPPIEFDTIDRSSGLPLPDEYGEPMKPECPDEHVL